MCKELKKKEVDKSTTGYDEGECPWCGQDILSSELVEGANLGYGNGEQGPMSCPHCRKNITVRQHVHVWRFRIRRL